MTDNFLDDPASTASKSIDTFLQDNVKGLDFQSANEIATATTALTAPQNLEEEHDNIVNELVSNGSSDKVSSLRSAIQQGKQQELRQAIYSKLTDIKVPLEEKEKLRQLYVESEREAIYNNVDIEKEMLRTFSAASVQQAQDAEEAALRDMWHSGVEDTIDIRAELHSSIESFRDRIALAAKEHPLGTAGKVALDTVQSVLVPGDLGVFYAQTLKQFLPEKNNTIKDFLLSGEAVKIIQDHLSALPPQEQLTESKRLLSIIENTISIFGDNGINKWDAASTLLNPILEGTPLEDFNWSRLLTNIGSAVDVLGLGAAMKKAPSIFSRLMGQLPKLEVANPKAATTLVKEAIDSEKVAQKLGKTSDEVYMEHALPVMEIKGMKVGQEHTIRTMNVSDTEVLKSFQLSEGTEESVRKVLDIQNSTYAFTTPELRKAATDKLIDEVQNIPDMVLRNNATAMGDAPFIQGADGISFKAAFGKTSEHGFSSWAEAVGTAKKAMPGSAHKILVASPETGGMLKYVEEVPTITKGEYFVEVQKFMYYDQASEVLDLGRVTTAGSMTDYLMDYNTVLNPTWADAVGRMKDMDDTARNTFFHVWKPVLSAVQKDEKVLPILMEGLSATQKAGRRLASSELDRIGLSTPELQKLYTAQIDATDAAAIVNNSRVRNSMISSGFDREIVHESTGFKSFGKVFDIVPNESVEVVYDIASKGFKNVNAQELAKLYEQGHRVAKLESSLTKISEAAGEEARVLGSDFVLLRKGSKTKVQELSPWVTGYIPGYMPRKFTDPYFIVKVIPKALINGREPISNGIKGFSMAVSSAPTASKGQKAVDILNTRATQGVRYELRYDRNIAREQTDLFHKQLDASRGTALKSRGQGLTNIENILGAEHGLDVLAETQHPMKAMENMLTAAARNASHDRTIRGLQQGFTNKYSDLLEHTGGKWPLSEGMIGSGQPSARLREARAMYRHISRLSSVEDSVGKTGREAMLRLSEWLGDKKFEKASEFVSGHRDISPLRTARAVNFFRMIAANPIRQWILQPSQILQTAGAAPKYAMTRLIPDMSLVLSGLLLKNMPANSVFKNAIPGGMGAVAKAFGTSEKNFVRMLQSIEDSGIMITDSHAFLKNINYKNMSDLYNSSLEKNVMNIANNLKRINRLFVDVGFNPAEKMNMMGQWLIARNRVLKKTPDLVPGTKIYRETIAAEARGISLGMKHGFAYSDNQFSALATQFLTFQHKSMLAIMGGNKYFSASDRVGMALTQTLLWGTTGLGLRSALDSFLAKMGIEKDKQTPTMKEAITVVESGLLERMINGVLSASGIDDMKVDWANSFSVYNAYENNLVKAAISLFGGEKQIGVDLLFGPSATTYSATMDMLSTMAMINKSYDMDNAKFWELHIKEAASWLPLVSRSLQFQVAFNTGLLPNATGTYFTNASMKEGAWYALTGMQSKERVALFDAMDLTSNGKSKDAKSDARVIYEQMSKMTTVLDAEDLTPDFYSIYDKKLKASLMLVGTVLDKADPFYKAGIERELGNLIRDDPKRGKDSLLHRLGKFYTMLGQDGQQTLHQLTRIRNRADDLKLDDSERQGIDSLINYYKESMDAYNQDLTAQENK